MDYRSEGDSGDSGVLFEGGGQISGRKKRSYTVRERRVCGVHGV